jgi:hypothetical protein
MTTTPSSHPIRHRHSPVVAACLSLLLPGVGQIVCRQDNKGVLLFGLFVFGHWATGGVSSLIICPAIGMDAYQIARKINNGGVIRRWEFFPAIKGLNSLPSRLILLAVVVLIAALAVIRIVRYAADYHPGN